jgi:hypothetical protein
LPRLPGSATALDDRISARIADDAGVPVQCQYSRRVIMTPVSWHPATSQVGGRHRQASEQGLERYRPPPVATSRLGGCDDYTHQGGIRPSGRDGILFRCRREMANGPPYRLRDHATADGVEDDLRGVVQIQLLQDVGSVGLDRGRADGEEVGHLFVGVPFGDELKDLPLAFR